MDTAGGRGMWRLVAMFGPLALVLSCGGAPDTGSLNECLRELDCPAGETCCNGQCITVGATCGGDPSDTVARTDADAFGTTDAGSDATTCTPDCTGRQCGDDGCGGSCGACDVGAYCAAGQCEEGGRPPALWGQGMWGQSLWAP